MEMDRILLRDEEALKGLLKHLKHSPAKPIPSDLARDLRLFLDEAPLHRLRIPTGPDCD